MPDLPDDVRLLLRGMLARDRAARCDLQAVAELLRRYTKVDAPTFGAPRFSAAHEAEPQAEAPASAEDLALATTLHGPLGAPTEPEPRPALSHPEAPLAPSAARRPRRWPLVVALGGLSLLGGALAAAGARSWAQPPLEPDSTHALIAGPGASIDPPTAAQAPAVPAPVRANGGSASALETARAAPPSATASSARPPKAAPAPTPCAAPKGTNFQPSERFE